MDDAARAHALDMLMAFLLVSLLAIGLLSMLIGKVVEWYDRGRAFVSRHWHTSLERAVEERARREVEDYDEPPVVPAAPGGIPPVYVPVSRYGMDASYQASPEPEPEPAAPDMDAEHTDMPRVSSTLTDGEFLVLLAMQRLPNGKHRLSANAIHSIVGGDRNTVLARVRELRSAAPPAQFPPLSPEQRRNREHLGMPQQ